MENEIEILRGMVNRETDDCSKKLIRLMIKEIYTAKILMKYLNFELLESDEFYWLKINNQNMYNITKEEYNILKEWRK